MAQQENPFYLSIHYTAPHSPWEANEHPKKYVELYKDCDFTSTPDLPVHPWQVATCPVGDTPEKRKENLIGYYASITAMDAGIDKIIKKLEEENLAHNTMIIFTADNGMNMGHHGVWGKGNGTYPPNMYDSSIKVPLFVYDPRTEKESNICHSMVSQYDIFPTILDFAECPYKLEHLQPGKSLVPLLDSDTEDNEDRVVIYDEDSKTRMIKRNHYKYIHRYDYGPCEFYNLNKDPNENKNLYKDDNIEKS